MDEHFVVDSDAKAAWAMRKYREAERKMVEIQKVVSQEMQTITDWAAKSSENVSRELQHFEFLLTAYLEQQRRDHDRKSVDLPTGRISSRISSATWDIDQAEFIKWARDFAPNLVRSKTTEMPEVQDVLREHLETSGGKVVVKETGEVVEGIKVKDPTLKITIEVKE